MQCTCHWNEADSSVQTKASGGSNCNSHGYITPAQKKAKCMGLNKERTEHVPGDTWKCYSDKFECFMQCTCHWNEADSSVQTKASGGSNCNSHGYITPVQKKAKCMGLNKERTEHVPGDTWKCYSDKFECWMQCTCHWNEA